MKTPPGGTAKDGGKTPAPPPKVTTWHYGTTTRITSVDLSRHNGFAMAGVWRKDDAHKGRIVVVYRESAEHVDYAGINRAIWSDDNGATWTSPVTILTDPTKDYREGAIQERPNGGLFLGTGWRSKQGVNPPVGNAELYDLSWDQAGKLVMKSAGVITTPDPKQYIRVKHCTSVIEVTPNFWLAAADAMDVANVHKDAMIWKSTDRGASWSIQAIPAKQTELGTPQGECALVPDPVDKKKIWFHVRDTGTESGFRRWYATSADHYTSWKPHGLVPGFSGSPRGRVIDGELWMGMRSTAQDRPLCVLWAADAEHLHTLGNMNSTLFKDMGTGNEGLFAYGQMVKTLNGRMLFIWANQKTNRNSDLVVTEILPGVQKLK